MKVAEMKINGKEIDEAKINGQVVYRKTNIENLVLKAIYQKSKISTSVTVTIIANNLIKTIGPGTWLKVDDYSYKKVYQNTQTQTVTVTDVNNDTANIFIDCRENENNLDATIDYEYQESKARVKVTIIANREIKPISGYQVQDKTTQVMYYYKNQTKNITIEDLEGNKLTIQIIIDQFA